MKKLIFVFNLPNHSSRTTAMGITQTLEEIRTIRSFWGVKRGRRVGLRI
jgi:hypothetical protein